VFFSTDRCNCYYSLSAVLWTILTDSVVLSGQNTSCDGEQQELYLVQEAKNQQEEERPAKWRKICSDMQDTAANEKIPRPPNAYIIFAKEWRKKVATEYPLERNISINKR
jgi:hypothetical protein